MKQSSKQQHPSKNSKYLLPLGSCPIWVSVLSSLNNEQCYGSISLTKPSPTWVLVNVLITSIETVTKTVWWCACLEHSPFSPYKSLIDFKVSLKNFSWVNILKTYHLGTSFLIPEHFWDKATLEWDHEALNHTLECFEPVRLLSALEKISSLLFLLQCTSVQVEFLNIRYFTFPIFYFPSSYFSMLLLEFSTKLDSYLKWASFVFLRTFNVFSFIKTSLKI